MTEQNANEVVSRRNVLKTTGGVFAGTTLAGRSAARTDRGLAASDRGSPGRGSGRRDWNSVVLFFNVSGSTPDGYSHTSTTAATEWLDEGANPASPTVSEYMHNYWETISYGELSFGIETPRDENGDPIVPTFSAGSIDPTSWGRVIDEWLDHDAEAVWQAAGGLTKNGKRWIPSLVLVQNFDVHASATGSNDTRTVDGEDYLVGGRIHIEYDLDFAPGSTQRANWDTLAHEYSHTFVAHHDLYGPEGSAGYYDLLGNRGGADGKMSELSSVHKEMVGWLEFDEVVEGPYFSTQEVTLRPYTTTGDAVKIVPDPRNNPHEYFLLEYRRSTGEESWRPDGGLDDEGLLITHMNERLGEPNNWLLRNAPYFDPEFADASDAASTERVSISETDGTFYPSDGNDSFTPNSTPSSDFYGGRQSNLYIRNIRLDEGSEYHVVKCTVAIFGPDGSRSWTPSGDDRGVAGRFTTDDADAPDEIFLRNDDEAALLTHSEAQWFVETRQDDRIGSWNLGPGDREYAADLDGDGADEVFIRSDDWAGVLEWDGDRFDARTIHEDWILARELERDGWNLGGDDREYVGDFDGDGADEVYLRSDEWAGIVALEGDVLDNQAIHHRRVGEWNLSGEDDEYVGRFSRTDRDELLVRSDDWIGLLYYDDGARRLRCKHLQDGWVGDWNLGATDRHVVGDFDGDGRDEVFVRGEGRWSGVIEWEDGGFQLTWINKGGIEYEGGDNRTLTPKASDDYYAGQFLPNPVWSSNSTLSPRPDRDGVLLVRDNDDPLNILTWEDGAMKVRFASKGGLMEWREDDELVLGDFHPHETDRAKPENDYLGDGGTDIFICNDWGTGMVGVNYVEHEPRKRPGDIMEEMGIAWKQKDYLLSRD